ncbi:MAG: adenylate/guanylate cyclase domain-containing protein [Arenicellales bacterium]|nr:adenylate/guanylate cyclase domain-containing protein [Arenicellales bacterium]
MKLKEAEFTSPKNYIPKHLADRIIAARDSLIGERKQVTVLYSDVKGSTNLISAQDAETADALLHPIIKIMINAVHRYEGTVTRVAGDGIMALFGAPIAHEDHAVRACFAALVMQRAVREHNVGLRREHGISIQIRIGLNSGEAVVRSIGNDLFMEYTAMGKTAHLAARMEQLADPGSIFLSDVTYQLAEGFVDVKDLGEVQVKGFENPVDVYELTGAYATRRRFQAAALRGLTTFVGRRNEFDALKQAFAGARQGHGQMVAVVGEAAVGKSRLFYEFTHIPRNAGWLVLEGGSSSFGKATPFLPVIDLLKSYFNVEAADDHRAVQEKVSGKILTLDKSLTPFIPVFSGLLDVPIDDPQWEAMDASERRLKTLNACKHLLVKESQKTPLVLVFEDLHWIDSKTQAFLDSFVDIVPSTRILLLVNYRPEYQHSWGGRPFYTQIYLESLSNQSAHELLDLILGTNPNLSSLKEQLIEQTEGNPFFIEESVRALVETGTLLGEPGNYYLAKVVENIEIPASVQAVLAARIDRLPAREKFTLQTSSVIGETFLLSLLVTIAEQTEEELHSVLDRLQALEFLYETALFPEHEYTFKHGLTYQVAYNSLLRERRRLLHSQILETLETKYSDRRSEDVNRLAHHAFEGEIWSKALDYLRAAGTKAATRSAYSEAVIFFERALMALGHLPENRDLLSQALDIQFELRTSLFPLGKHEDVLKCLQRAGELSEDLEDPLRQAWVSIYKCHYFWIVGQSKKAFEQGRSADSVKTSVSNFSLNVTINYYLGLACLSVGEYTDAIDFFRNNVESLEDEAPRERYGVAGFPAAMSATYMAWALSECGRFNEGLRYGQNGVLLAKEINHAWTLVTAFWGLASLHINRRDAHAAINLLEQAVPLSREWNLEALTPGIKGSLGFAYAISGRLEEGLQMLKETVKDIEASGRLAFHTLLNVYLGEVLIKVSEYDAAETITDRALNLARERGEKGFEAMALHLMAEVCVHTSSAKRERAKRLYGESIEMARTLNMRPLVARCNLGLGYLLRQLKNTDQSREKYLMALSDFRDMQMQQFVTVTETALRDF